MNRAPSTFVPVVFQVTASLLLLVLAIAVPAPDAAAQTRTAVRKTGSLKVITGHPGSVVFINNVRHGVTGEDGILDLKQVWTGSFPVRVRTLGFLDWSGRTVVAAGTTRTLQVKQQPTDDEALLAFQKAERLRDDVQHTEAAIEYHKAVALRPTLLDARIGLTRSLMVLQEYQEAEKHIQFAVRASGNRSAEAQTVLANVRRSQGLVEESIREYRKALRIARGVSPEANIGLAIALQEMGDMDDAIRHYRIGISQDMDTEPILYYLLGSALEKEGRNREAIEAYGNYLRLDPEGTYASAIESMIEQLRQPGR